MKLLFIDTETTGLWNFHAPLEDPTQPDMVQIALAILNTDTDRILFRFCSLIEQDGEDWEIPPEATQVHGITKAMVKAYGIPLDLVDSIMVECCGTADQIVIYNAVYDIKVIKRAYLKHWDGVVDITFPIDESKVICAMRAATPICKLPGRYGQHKWPRLCEAHEILCECPLIDAHDAMGDVLGTINVYRELHKLGAI